MSTQIVHKDCGNPVPLDALLAEICPHCNGVITADNTGCINLTDPFEGNEQAYYTSKFTEAAESVVELARGIKTSDYGETWRRLGLKGIYVKIFIKEGRLNELIWNKDCKTIANKNEGIKDTLQDIVAYGLYGLIALEEDNIFGDEASAVYLNTMIKGLLETIKRARTLEGKEKERMIKLGEQIKDSIDKGEE
jgi:hypothetical protein